LDVPGTGRATEVNSRGSKQDGQHDCRGLISGRRGSWAAAPQLVGTNKPDGSWPSRGMRTETRWKGGVSKQTGFRGSREKRGNGEACERRERGSRLVRLECRTSCIGRGGKKLTEKEKKSIAQIRCEEKKEKTIGRFQPATTKEK